MFWCTDKPFGDEEKRNAIARSKKCHASEAGK